MKFQYDEKYEESSIKKSAIKTVDAVGQPFFIHCISIQFHGHLSHLKSIGYFIIFWTG